MKEEEEMEFEEGETLMGRNTNSPPPSPKVEKFMKTMEMREK